MNTRRIILRDYKKVKSKGYGCTSFLHITEVCPRPLVVWMRLLEAERYDGNRK